MFTPFTVLFYTEAFWQNLLYMLPLFIYAWMLVTIAHMKGWLKYGATFLLVVVPSGVVVTILAYYLFFHEGVLSAGAVEAEAVSPGTMPADMAATLKYTALWPYVAYAIVLTVFVWPLLQAKIRNGNVKNPGNLERFILPILAINLLPLFTGYYWWAMLAGIVVIISVLRGYVSYISVTTSGGMSFVISYAYMMIASLSIVLYAFLY